MLLLRPIRWALSLATTLALLYLFFFVPIGQRTLYEHVRRVAGTEEARELGRDVRGVSQRVLERVSDEVRENVPLLPSAGTESDGGGSVDAAALPWSRAPLRRRR